MKSSCSMAVANATCCAAGWLMAAATPAHGATAAGPPWTPPVQQTYCLPKQGAQTGTGLVMQRAERAGGPHRWTGWLRIAVQGDYRFLPTVPGVRLRIGGQNLAQGGGTLPLAADSWHAVQVIGPPGAAAADEAPWAWIPPQGQRQGVPRESLFAPMATIERP